VEESSPVAGDGHYFESCRAGNYRKDLSLPQSALRDALNPDVFVRTRVTTGSVAPNEVDRMLASEQQGLEQMTAWLSAEKKTHYRCHAEARRSD
jgi:hypothetical protein